jgi:SAM-dependent methyltransferase
MGFNSQTFWAPRLGAHGLWKHLVTPYLLTHSVRRPRMFVDLGCGIGEFIFAIHSETLCNGSRYVGLDTSPTAIEVASLRATLLDGQKSRPEFSFRVSDINDLKERSIKCHGMDVVVYCVSALNKISNLRDDYYNMLLSALAEPRNVDIIHVETTGWQASFDQDLRDFYLGLGPMVQGSLAISSTIDNQRKSVMARGGNVNLMGEVKHAQMSGRVRIVNVFFNYFMPNPGAAYSIIHLKLNRD